MTQSISGTCGPDQTFLRHKVKQYIEVSRVKDVPVTSLVTRRVIDGRL